jgi:hypothetical protein
LLSVQLREFSFERAISAVEKVRERLLRATAALEAARVPYAVADGNAVALWVSRVDEAAVRNTQDVDILIRRSDLPAARAAMEKAGFTYRHMAGMDMFLDGPGAKARNAVHIVFAGEKVRAEEPLANPDVEESEQAEQFRILALPALVQTKLTAFRDKDKVHLRDLIDVGLIDRAWLNRFPKVLSERLASLLDNPNG